MVINRLEEWLMAALLAFMTVLTFVQVVLRYVFNSGWVWSLEATTYSFAALVLVGMSYGVRTRTHIAIDLFIRKLPTVGRRYIDLIAVVACLAYALLMLYGSAVLVDRMLTLGNDARDIPVPKWLLTATMPLGFALLAYRFLESGWHLLRYGDDRDHPHAVPTLADDDAADSEDRV
ncbi:MAG: TRAP transporter small permease [Woeseiaceae bacterium]|nr:TRAP transporter small permease [Woeseiaceae bacterium]